MIRYQPTYPSPNPELQTYLPGPTFIHSKINNHRHHSRTTKGLSITLLFFALNFPHSAHALEIPPQQENPLPVIEPLEMTEPQEETNEPAFEVIEDASKDNPLPAPTTKAAITAEDSEFKKLSNSPEQRRLTLPGGNRINISRSGPFIPVNYRNPRVRSGDTLSVSLTPIGASRTAWISTPVTAQGPGLLTLTIPVNELAKYIGGSVNITVGAARRGEGGVKVSRHRTVSVAVTSGEVIAQRLNNRYRNTANRCTWHGRSDYPAYYCNGIIARTVDNGDFDPWLPSQTAVDLGGISFSYFRIDSLVTNFYRRAGFIFLPQREALNQGRAVDYLCIYAYDAWTTFGQGRANGCGLRTRVAGSTDPSSCANQNATTVQGWYNHIRTINHNSFQCSLSTRDAAQFAVSLAVRRNPPNDIRARVSAPWNELMVALWLNAGERLPLSNDRSRTIGTRLPIEAFFYRIGDAQSLAAARAFQSKFKARTNLWVPIVRLDLRQINGFPFSYNSADQAVQR